MRYVTFSADGRTSWGVALDDGVVDVPAAAAAARQPGWPDTLLGFIQQGGLEHGEGVAGLVALARGTEALRRWESVRLLAPIPRPARNIFALGLNYADHAAESRGGGAKLPEAPIYFTKATTTVIGPEADIVLDPRVTKELDWEVELGAVVGRGGRWIPESEALSGVFGYTVLNDVSARDLQRGRGGQFFLGKSVDTGCPMGPWIVSADEIPDPQSLEVRLRVNGVEKQHSNTRHMIFGVARLIADLSSVLTLEPGDIISTGTPAGVGFARKPPEFLKPGDAVEVEIDRIGVLRNRVRGV